QVHSHQQPESLGWFVPVRAAREAWIGRKRRRKGQRQSQLPEQGSLSFISSPRLLSKERFSQTRRSSALAVLRLITSSYLVGACTGKSAGFAPLRIRST